MAGSSNLTQNQMLEAIAVLLCHLRMPPTVAHPKIFVNSANQIQFADAAFEQGLGNNLVATTDGTNIYLQLVEGQPSSGA